MFLNPFTKDFQTKKDIVRGVVETNLVAPSAGRDAFLATTALSRVGQAHEVANVILFMLSDQASFMTASVSCHIRLFVNNADGVLGC